MVHKFQQPLIAKLIWFSLRDINKPFVQIQVKVEVGKYAEWVEKVQHKPDALVDVRVEPKFTIPDGTPYADGWCRPQTDGPGYIAS